MAYHQWDIDNKLAFRNMANLQCDIDNKVAIYMAYLQCDIDNKVAICMAHLQCDIDKNLLYNSIVGIIPEMAEKGVAPNKN